MDILEAALCLLGVVSMAGVMTGVLELLQGRSGGLAQRLHQVRDRLALRDGPRGRTGHAPDGAEQLPSLLPDARPADPSVVGAGSPGSDLASVSFWSRLRQRRTRQDYLPLVTQLIRQGPFAFLQGLEHDLVRLRVPLKASELLAVSLAGGLACAVVLRLITGHLAFSLLVSVVVFAAPLLSVRVMAQRWLVRFEQLLAETLLLMANSMRSGYGIMQAMTIVAEQGTPPLADEFQRALHAIQLGATVEEALHSLGERVKSRDLEIAVTAILVTRQMGGSLAEVLSSLAETVRERITLRRELRALTAEGRLSGIAMALLPLGLMVVLNLVTAVQGEEPYTRILFTDPIGQKMMIYWAVSLFIGFVAVRRIVSIPL